MLVIVGYIVVCASVFGGFVLAGGHMAVLFQPIELLMIGGAAVGASFVGNNAKTLKSVKMIFGSQAFQNVVSFICIILSFNVH